MTAVDYTKEPLSESTDGRPIQVTATSSPGTLIHTCSDDPDDQDELWVYAFNTTSGNVVVTLEFGGTSASDALPTTVHADSDRVISRGMVLPGKASPLEVRAYATSGSVINVQGYANRITQTS